jgi:hypothetical protein
MEKLGVFIPLERVSNFRAGLPVDRSLLDGEVKGVHREGAEGIFSEIERAVFFQNVEKVYKDATVLLMLGLGERASRPLLARAPTEAEASHNLRGRVRAPNSSPGGSDRGVETIMKGPGWLVGEGATFWNGGGDRGHKRHVVRRVACERSEGGGGEKGIPGVVDEDPV